MLQILMHAWYAPEQIVGEEEKNQILYVWIRGYFHVILRAHTATEDSCFVYLENNISPPKVLQLRRLPDISPLVSHL